MRQVNYPKDGHIFRHKTNTDVFSRELYLAESETLDKWEEITESEYEAIQEEIRAKAFEKLNKLT